MKIFKLKKCDNCGKLNPPVAYKGARTTTCCASEKGMYSIPESKLLSLGKTYTVWFRLELPWKIY